jgi:hypothetical protein
VVFLLFDFCPETLIYDEQSVFFVCFSFLYIPVVFMGEDVSSLGEDFISVGTSDFFSLGVPLLFEVVDLLVGFAKH